MKLSFDTIGLLDDFFKDFDLKLDSGYQLAAKRAREFISSRTGESRDDNLYAGYPDAANVNGLFNGGFDQTGHVSDSRFPVIIFNGVIAPKDFQKLLSEKEARALHALLLQIPVFAFRADTEVERHRFLEEMRFQCANYLVLRGLKTDQLSDQLKRPSKKAFMAWQLRELLGITTQTEIAAKMTEEGVPASQGGVCRLLQQVDKYLAAANVLPMIDPLTSQPQSIDPTVIDMGKRQDGRTPRQRKRRDSGSNDR